MPNKKSVGGRPPIAIDEDLVEKLSGIQCTDAEIAAVLGISYRAFKYKKAKSEDLRDRIERGHLKGRVAIRRKQFQLMEAGNATMAIWLGKQVLGQRDQVAADVNPGGSISLATVDALLAAAGPRKLPPTTSAGELISEQPPCGSDEPHAVAHGSSRWARDEWSARPRNSDWPH